MIPDIGEQRPMGFDRRLLDDGPVNAFIEAREFGGRVEDRITNANIGRGQGDLHALGLRETAKPCADFLSLQVADDISAIGRLRRE